MRTVAYWRDVDAPVAAGGLVPDGCLVRVELAVPYYSKLDRVLSSEKSLLVSRLEIGNRIAASYDKPVPLDYLNGVLRQKSAAAPPFTPYALVLEPLPGDVKASVAFFLSVT